MNTSSFKSQVQLHFDQSAETYENVCHIQQESAQHLVKLLHKNWPSFLPKSILDIGTGTGTLLPSLLSYFPQATYLLNDLSSLMIKQAKDRFSSYPNLYYQVGDAETLDFYFHDLIISNFAFQWFSHLPETLSRLFNQSEILAFTTLTAGTFSEWAALYQELGYEAPLLDFPSIHSLKKLCANLDPEEMKIENKMYTLNFPHALAFVRYLKELGAYATPRFFSSPLLKIIRYHSKPLTVSYQVIFILLKRKISQ